jgi:hypothetical protein
MAEVVVVPGVPVSIANPSVMISYGFANAGDTMNWVSADGSLAGIAPFFRPAGSPIWSKAPETMFDYIERFCANAGCPYKFVMIASGTIFVDTNAFPVYATEEKAELIISFSCGILGEFEITANRLRIRSNGIAVYEFGDMKTFAWYESGGIIVPGAYVYMFDDGYAPDNFQHSGTLNITFGGGIGAAWSGPI